MKRSHLGIGLGVIAACMGGAYLYAPIEPGISYSQKQRIVTLVSEKLDDPYSAHISFRGWAKEFRKDAQGLPVPRDGKPLKGRPPGVPVKIYWDPIPWYCGTVNAKNQFGAYTGSQFFAANPTTGAAFVGTEAIERASKAKLVPAEALGWCTDQGNEGYGKRDMFKGQDR
ncbi:MAG TPA: hypothetical protein VFQ69_01140 [Rhizomicrobium sp.]|nr:hypothetical protein [Rhizomicrobium sp.]